MAYASAVGHVLVDRRLYLPESWAEDAARRERAGVPPGVAFQTKPQLAQAMLEHLWARGLPMGWVSGDEVYGNAAPLRERIAAAGYRYVQRVWTTRPAMEAAGAAARGRPRTRVRLVADEPPAQEVREVVAGWPTRRWQRLVVAQGEQGERLYDWAALRVVESQDDLPGQEVWLLARRSVADPTELAYYLAHAPADTPLGELARVAAQRYVVEQCLEEAKGETGLDEYEVRRWDSWHRHITLAIMAYALLGWLRYRQTVKKGGLSPSSPN
ncbi:MAG: IS701 family transposase [Anaerolineae bacterium]